jgi:hypothetical protein
MKRRMQPALLIILPALSLAAPPPGLDEALAKWAAPRPVARYQLALVDLNGDAQAEAVVHVTDPGFCGNGGCPLVAFHKAADGYQVVASSGLVRKPVYTLEEKRDGWNTLAAVVGFGDRQRVVPIRYQLQEQGYRRAPYLNPEIELTVPTTKQALNFEEVP